MNDIALFNLPFKWEKKSHRLEHVIRLESDKMEICKPKEIRKKKWLGFSEKILVIHMDKNLQFTYYDI